MKKNKITLTATQSFWNISVLGSFYYLALPHNSVWICLLFGLLLVIFDFIAPAEIPKQHRRKWNLFTTSILTPIIITLAVWHISSGNYQPLHAVAGLFAITEISLRIYLIFHPNKRLPEVFYTPRRKYRTS